MSTQVRILKVTYISLPESPTPTNDRIALSFFDAMWIPLPPNQRLIFYDDTALLPPFTSLLQSLKSSLSSALVQYTPLAGKLTYLPSSGEVVIDCSAAAVGDGVAFVEAEADGDIRRLAGEEDHDVEAFSKLVPGLGVGELPARVFSVQATRFVGGGMAVGVSAHHAVVDGKALWMFLEAWAACCRGNPPVKATFDRAVIRHPKGEEITRRFVKMAPSLPVISIQKELSNEGRFQLSRRTFVLSSATIRSLKQRILQLHTNPALPPPSTFVSLTAKIWVAFVQSKSFNPADDVHLAFLADCRARLDPPIDESYFGNCVKGCYARATAADLLGEDGLFVASSAVQKAIRESLEDVLAGCEGTIEAFMALPRARTVNVTASPRFKVYELADFGWGKPSRVELVSMNQDGGVVLSGSKEGGGVQVSVSLDTMHMEAFKNHFLN